MHRALPIVILSALLLIGLSCDENILNRENLRAWNVEEQEIIWQSHGMDDYVIEQGPAHEWYEDFAPHYNWTYNSQITFVSNNIPVKSFDLSSLKTTKRMGRTINELFFVIDTVNRRNPYMMEVEYDTIYGFPVKIWADQDKLRTDDGFLLATRFIYPDSLPSKTTAYRRIWDSISTPNYVIQQDDIVLSISENKIISGSSPNGIELDISEYSHKWTVKELFDIIDFLSIAEDIEVLEVEYDNLFGYPKTISIDQSLTVSPYREITIHTQLKVESSTNISH